MPTPASESTEALASPVATYSLFPLGSLGSIRIEPIALLPSEPLTYDHVAFAPSSALSVTQMPPPAAPM